MKIILYIGLGIVAVFLILLGIACRIIFKALHDPRDGEFKRELLRVKKIQGKILNELTMNPMINSERKKFLGNILYETKVTLQRIIHENREFPPSEKEVETANLLMKRAETIEEFL